MRGQRALAVGDRNNLLFPVRTTDATTARIKLAATAQGQPPASNWIGRAAFAGVAIAGALAGAAALWILAGGEAGTGADAGPVHVHGLGVNPADGALFIATHTGMYRVGASETKAERVGDSRQDTMGFTIAGPNRFLGSGHPDLRENLPPLLGLIESRDEGRTWASVSLSGETDFHVLRTIGERIYGYDATSDRLLASADGGRAWDVLERPAPLLDFAPNPSDERHLVATAADLGQGLYGSRDGGRSWRSIGGEVGLLAWSRADALYLVDGRGEVSVSADAGQTFDVRGSIGGQPAALLARGAELLVALHDGTIRRSVDGGRTWAVRSTP